ncbi:BA75_04547T0 [Komagataella pastoris]|uniref:BA75_04547T0 n=1 Tax=Komagataella pastoris TaxID=4922 RepID=A0A1B2JHC9_PICPA|nr:BA75_04547T0 [Komagataella pastoris]
MRSPKDSHSDSPDFALYMPGPHELCSSGYQFDNYTNTKMSDNSQTESRLSSETLNLTYRRPSLDKIMLSYAIAPHLPAYYGDYYSVIHFPFEGRSMYDSRLSPPYNAFIWCKKLISCIQPTR